MRDALDPKYEGPFTVIQRKGVDVKVSATGKDK